MKKKIIQVPMPEDLLSGIDAVAEKRGDSRAALIREACSAYIKKLREDEAVAAYIRSYEELPETEEERQWAEAAEKLSAEILVEEDWDEEYDAFIKAEEKLAQKSA